MMPKRIQMRRTKGWRKPAGAIYVGRPTTWGNPGETALFFRMWLDGTLLEPARTWFAEPPFPARRAEILSSLGDLRGRDLGCWCKLCARHKDGKPFDEPCADCAPCHADVLGELANGPNSARLIVLTTARHSPRALSTAMEE
jgi:hypothetical protein